MAGKNTLNWGLIGCGDIARRRVAPALRDLGTCRLIAVNRANPELLASFAEEFHAEKTYTNWQDLLRDSNIDAVYIATPVHLHAEIAVQAADSGKHVLCEKPMALNNAECQRMIDSCKKNHARLGVAYYRHFYPVVHHAKDLIKQGLIGDVMLTQINAFSSFNRQPDEPRYWLLEKEKSGGGPMMDFGCHRIEVLINLLGPIDRVRSVISKLRYDRNVEDTATAHFSFQNGSEGMLTVTHTVFEDMDTLDIFGTRGSIHIPVLNKGDLILMTRDGQKQEYFPPHDNLHLPLIEDFTTAVLENRNPMVDGSIGYQVNKILTKIYANSF